MGVFLRRKRAARAAGRKPATAGAEARRYYRGEGSRAPRACQDILGSS